MHDHSDSLSCRIQSLIYQIRIDNPSHKMSARPSKPPRLSDFMLQLYVRYCTKIIANVLLIRDKYCQIKSYIAMMIYAQ